MPGRSPHGQARRSRRRDRGSPPRQHPTRASAIVERYGQLGYHPRPVFDLTLNYAISEDGALHAEKYYRTAFEEFATNRPAFRWRQLTALTRVTASEYGRPAPGVAEARRELGV